MVSDWRLVQISDIGRVVTGRTPPGNDSAYYGCDVPFLTPSDMGGGRQADKTARSLSSYGAQRLVRCLVPRGVGISCIGWQMGKSILIDRPTITNQQINSIIVNEDTADLSFVYYSMLLRRDELFNLGAGGSRTPILNKGDFERLSIALPPLVEQRAIAHVLGTLDDKIELNRQMNETLETIARTLFKSWFVDFDPVRAKAEGRDPGLPKHIADLFPDSFEDSELGEIPRGWPARRLGELLRLDKGLSYKGQFLTRTGVPMINLGCFLGRGRFAEQAIKRYSGEFKARHVVHANDLLLANTDITQRREVIGSPSLVPPQEGATEMLFTHHIFASRFFSGSKTWKLFIYFLLLQENFRARAAGFATGTTVLALPQDAVLDHQFSAPSDGLIQVFNLVVAPLIERQWHNENESRSLSALRDSLLPKLICGELRVDGARHVAEEALSTCT